MKTAVRVAVFLTTLFPCILRSQNSSGSLVGRLSDPTGVALGGNYFTVGIQTTDSIVRRETHPNDSGEYKFEVLPPGEYTMRVRALGFDAPPMLVNITASEQRSLPPIRLSVASSGCFDGSHDSESTKFLSADSSVGGIYGLIKSGDRDVAGARVTLRCWVGLDCAQSIHIATSDNRGRFRFERFPPDRYLLSIEKKGFNPLMNLGFVIAGGVGSTYRFNLLECTSGNCTPDPSARVLNVCE